MSDADDAKMIEEMERLEREATAAPWTDSHHHRDENEGMVQSCVPVEAPSLQDGVMSACSCCQGIAIKLADLSLIVTARNNLPRLIALAKIGLESSKKEQT